MKKALRILGVLLWIIGIVWVIWIVGAVVSRTEGYNTLTNLIGAFVFHTVCMIGGALCLFNSRPQPALESQQPAQAAPKA